MYIPWFAGTDEAARLAHRACEQDYLQWLAAEPESKPRLPRQWLAVVRVRLGDWLILSGQKIKAQAAPQPQRASLQTR
jgi:hypothetical protein